MAKCPLYKGLWGENRRISTKKRDWRKKIKNLKKPIDKGRGGWYYVKAVREDEISEALSRRQEQKTLKKVENSS